MTFIHNPRTHSSFSERNHRLIEQLVLVSLSQVLVVIILCSSPLWAFDVNGILHHGPIVSSSFHLEGFVKADLVSALDCGLKLVSACLVLHSLPRGNIHVHYSCVDFSTVLWVTFPRTTVSDLMMLNHSTFSCALFIHFSVCQHWGGWRTLHDPRRLRSALSWPVQWSQQQPKDCAALGRSSWSNQGWVRIFIPVLKINHTFY